MLYMLAWRGGGDYSELVRMVGKHCERRAVAAALKVNEHMKMRCSAAVFYITPVLDI